MGRGRCFRRAGTMRTMRFLGADEKQVMQEGTCEETTWAARQRLGLLFFVLSSLGRVAVV